MNMLRQIILSIAATCITSIMLSASIRYEVYHGQISEEHIQQLVPYDIELFYDYSYLFVENPVGSRAFLQSLSTPTTIIVVAYDADAWVGGLISYSVDGLHYNVL